MDLISIITPTYNSERYIAETIQSVIDQSYKEWEMIIIDDNSTDDSVAIIKSLIKDENRIILIELDENKGAAFSRNIGLQEASGKYISFLDSDDLWHRNKFEEQMIFMSKNEYPITFTTYELIDENGNSMNKIVQAKSSLGLNDYMKNTIIGFSTAIIDREKVGNFKFQNIRMKQDFQLWISILGSGFIAYGLDKNLVKYRIHDKSLSSNKLKAAIQVWNVLHNIEKIGFFHSVYYFSFYAINALIKRLFGKK